MQASIDRNPNMFNCDFARVPSAILTATLLALLPGLCTASDQRPFIAPVVARVEMKLAIEEKVVDVIEKGDLLTVLEETDETYEIMTHDGTRGIIEKVNAVIIAESGDIYTDLIQRNPDEGRYFTLRASSWWELGKPEKALEDFDNAIELGYTESHAYSSRGLFHAAMGNYADAIADYDKAIEIDPEDIAPIINRAAARISKGDFVAAVADYTLAISKKPNSASLLHQRAIAHKAAGKLDESISDFDAILENSPDNYAAVMGRGYVRFQKRDYQEAVADFGKAIELNPKDAVAWNNRGYNRHQLGRHLEALDDYTEAIKLAPKYALAFQNRSWLLSIVEDQEIHDPAAAVQSATKACELTNYESLMNLSALAAALAADGKFDKAVGWQEKVVEMSSDSRKEFAEKIMARYENERPYAIDPDKADAEDQATAEQEGAKSQQAKSDSDSEPKA